MALKVVFFGSPAFAVPTLQALVKAGHQVVTVVCQPDAPRDRGHKVQAPPVKEAALSLGLTVEQPVKLKPPAGDAVLSRIRALNPDVGVVVAYGRLLPQAWLDAPRTGCLNLHASLLPRHRGASPIHHAILSGDPDTGVGLMRMVQALDAGEVYATLRTVITPEDTSETLSERLSHLAAQVCVDNLEAVVAGRLTGVAQDPARVTLAPLLTKEMGRLDLGGSAEVQVRKVRALQPWPGAFILRAEAPLRVWKAQALPGAAHAPGTVVALGADSVDVACGEGVLRLLDVQPAGKRRMSAGEFSRGARLTVGGLITA